MFGGQRIAKVSLAATVLCSAVAAHAADWRYVTTGTSDMDVYVDFQSLREIPSNYSRPFTVRQIWVRWDHSRDRTVSYRETKLLFRFDCRSERSMTMSVVRYDATGRSLGGTTNRLSDSEWNYEPVVPDSINYAVMEVACGWR